MMHSALCCVVMCHAIFDRGDVVYALYVMHVMCVVRGLCVMHAAILCVHGMCSEGAVCDACHAATRVVYRHCIVM